jgi:gliding motility-associated-like protein
MKSMLPKKTSFLYWFGYFLLAILPITINAQTVPGAPTIGWATATGATSATVSFTAPTNNGGSPILRYVATSSPGGITGIFTGAGSGTITLNGLISDTPYNFTITAVNAVGSSIPSEVSNWVVPVRGPNAPTNVVAVAGNEQASISFTPPTDDGGTPIFHYTVVSNPGNISVTDTNSPIIVTGLTNGTAYTFVVSAENSMGGQGTPSAPSNSVTPGTPDAPTIGTATATGFTTATVAFTAPSNNGGSAITSYAVTSSPAGGEGTFTGAGSGTISVSNLTAGTTYTFTVKARNINGASNASAASNQIRTPIYNTVPDAPTIGTATATGPTTATVAFTAPINNGGSAITRYVVTSSPAGGEGSKEETGAGSGTIAIRNLTHNTNYTFSVKAVNGIGSSNASAASNQITTPSNLAPTPPAQPMVAGQLQLSKFTAVGADAGGAPLVTITFNNGTYVSFFAYASSFMGGVRVALGDINGDGNMDVITGAGPGGGPQVNVFNVNPSTGEVSLQKSFFAFNAPSFTGGIYVATGRTNADLYEDIIVGAGASGGSRVQVYAGSASGVVTTSTLNDFFAYSPAFIGGVRVAAGDRDGDWIDEVITAPASNAGYNIKSFKTNGKGNSPTVLDNFFAFNNTTSVGGLSIASGYLNSGNISDIIVGTSNGGFGVIIDSNTAGILATPFAGFNGTINVGVAQDANDIIYPMALAGPGGAPGVIVYKTRESSLVETDNLFVMNITFRGGLFGTPSIKNLENFGPTNITLSNESISENNAIGASIGTIDSTDPNLGDSFTYSLVSGAGSDDNSKFTIAGNTLKAADAFDYETKSSYKIRIQTSDVAGFYFQKEFTLTIVNVNEVPTAIVLSNASIDENNAIGATIGTLSTTDRDAGDSFSYSLVSGTGSTDNSKFTISGNTLKAAEAFDFETKSNYSIRIQTSDAGGLSFQKEFTLLVVNVNEAPTAIALSNATIDENKLIGVPLGNFATTDPDAGDSFTYKLVSGVGSDDNSKFTIAGNNTLIATEAFDFEIKSSYSIRIQTSDAGGLSFQKEFTMTIVNVNEAPTAIALSNATIDENNAIDASIGTLASTDPDAGDSFTYSLVNGAGSTDNSKFTISGNTLKAAEVLDFETKSTYSIRIQTSDAGGLRFQKTINISVKNINDSPSAIVISRTNLFETNPINQIIGLLSSTDQDAGDTHTYSLISGAGATDNADFNLSGNQLRASKVFSFASKSSYSIRIRTTDNSGISFDKAFSVTISQLPKLTGTGNESGSQIKTAASTSPKISKGYTSNLQVSGSDLVSYSWTPSSGLSSSSIANPIAELTETTTYSVLVTNSFGSSVTLNITVEVMEDFNLVVSNFVSPNGDGANDTWQIENLNNYPNNELVISDRNNNILYRQKNYSNNWDGQYNGSILPTGTYYYLLTFNSGASVKRGYITIINNIE